MKIESEISDPRIGKLSAEDARKLKEFAISTGTLDTMPFWMRKEIEEKCKLPENLFLDKPVLAR